VARLVVVTGGKGGPGATTLAVGLAGAWAAAGRSVLVADLDPAGGDVAAHLPVEDPRRGVAPLLGVVGSRLDAAAVAAESTMAGENLWVLNGLPRPDTAELLQPAATGALLAALRALDAVDLVVVDPGRLLPGSVAAVALAAADVGVLAVRPDLPGALAARRALDAAGDLQGLALVAVGTQRRRSGDVAELAEALGRQVDGVVPADGRGVRRAIQAARPPGRGRLGHAYATLAASLDAGEPTGRTRRGRVRRSDHPSIPVKEEVST
jgi:MinD-like ATPase involved in chromosome partitioning or flagellar assembly